MNIGFFIFLTNLSAKQSLFSCASTKKLRTKEISQNIFNVKSLVDAFKKNKKFSKNNTQKLNSEALFQEYVNLTCYSAEDNWNKLEYKRKKLREIFYGKNKKGLSTFHKLDNQDELIVKCISTIGIDQLLQNELREGKVFSYVLDLDDNLLPFNKFGIYARYHILFEKKLSVLLQSYQNLDHQNIDQRLICNEFFKKLIKEKKKLIKLINKK